MGFLGIRGFLRKLGGMGESRRLGGTNKLWREFDQEDMMGQNRKKKKKRKRKRGKLWFEKFLFRSDERDALLKSYIFYYKSAIWVQIIVFLRLWGFKIISFMSSCTHKKEFHFDIFRIFAREKLRKECNLLEMSVG